MKCSACGKEFDPLGFQIVVPELGRSFDSLECARQATLARAAPLALPVEAIAPAPAAGSPLARRSRRSLFAAGAGLAGVGAASAVAAAYLWMNAFETTPLDTALDAAGAPPTANGGTVPVDPSIFTQQRPARRSPEAAVSEAPAADAGGSTSATEAAGSGAAGQDGSDVGTGPTPAPEPVPPPTETPTPTPAPTPTPHPSDSDSGGTPPLARDDDSAGDRTQQKKKGGAGKSDKPKGYEKHAQKPKTHGHHENGHSHGAGVKKGHTKNH